MESLTTEQVNDAYSYALYVLENEINRIFGNDGVFRLINKHLEILSIIINDENTKSDAIRSAVKQHSALVDYIDLKTDKKIPF